MNYINPSYRICSRCGTYHDDGTSELCLKCLYEDTILSKIENREFDPDDFVSRSGNKVERKTEEV